MIINEKEREKIRNLYDDYIELYKKYSLGDVLIIEMFFLDGLVRTAKYAGITIEDLQQDIVFMKRKEEKEFEDIKDET